jgi:ATP-dependent DNA ligase
MLGGYVVTQENGKQCEVGSGIIDTERSAIWKDREAVVGRTIEVKYQELTPDGIMRFPTFIRFRNDK